jgi:uncharacterized protein YtpQ (UPF0354 family)
MTQFIRKYWVFLYIVLGAGLAWYSLDFAKRYKIEEQERMAEEKLEREEELKRMQAERNRSQLEIPVETGVAPIP